jgi:hypothetical protein
LIKTNSGLVVSIEGVIQRWIYTVTPSGKENQHVCKERNQAVAPSRDDEDQPILKSGTDFEKLEKAVYAGAFLPDPIPNIGLPG